MIVSMVFSFLLSRDGAAPALLEARDSTPFRYRPFDACVRGVTVRADLEHKLGSSRARREFVSAGATAHVSQLQIGMLPTLVHVVPFSWSHGATRHAGQRTGLTDSTAS